MKDAGRTGVFFYAVGYLRFRSGLFPCGLSCGLFCLPLPPDRRSVCVIRGTVAGKHTVGRFRTAFVGVNGLLKAGEQIGQIGLQECALLFTENTRRLCGIGLPLLPQPCKCSLYRFCIAQLPEAAAEEAAASEEYYEEYPDETYVETEEYVSDEVYEETAYDGQEEY